MQWARELSLRLDPTRLFDAAGMTADPWQRELLTCLDRQVLLNCSRQSGKSTAVSILALRQALFTPRSLVLLVSPSLRQSGEIFRKVRDAYEAVGRIVPAVTEAQDCLELTNGSRVVCLPGREQTIRSFGGVALLVLDEAARVPDILYRSVRPMLAVSQGRLVALSTPFGQRGWFYEEWHGSGPWRRFHVPWSLCPRITPEFIAEETRSLGPAWVDQEHNALFTAQEGLVYPDFPGCVVEAAPELKGKLVGGIDFGWRNPFAAVWGVLEAEDVLWITGERYCGQTALADHAAALKPLGDRVWYADPAGRTETEELRRAGLTVRAGDNDIRPGIAAVTARVRTGRLKVVGPACPHLLREAKLYRYPTAAERAGRGENPIDDNNHALAALRYLVARLDAGFMARLRRRPAGKSAAAPPGRDIDPEAVWETLH